MGASSAPVHHRYGAPRSVQLVVVVHWESIGVWPSRVTQSSFTPSNVPSPSRTANTGGLPWVHCLHSARCSSTLVGSKGTIIALILRPLMPPSSLIWFTKRLMALVCSPYSASDSISYCPSMLANEMIGKTTLMVLAVTPRALVLASLTGVGALLAPDGAATPNAAALARTATAPPARHTVRRTPDLHHRRMCRLPRVRRSKPWLARRKATAGGCTDGGRGRSGRRS